MRQLILLRHAHAEVGGEGAGLRLRQSAQREEGGGELLLGDPPLGPEDVQPVNDVQFR